MKCNHCGNEWFGLINENLGSYVQCPNCNNSFFVPPPIPSSKHKKQRTVLSVRDFAILYNIIDDKIRHMESQAQWVPSYFFHKEPTEEEKAPYIEKNMEQLKQDPHYQDLLRIREKLGELNIEVETPSVEVEE